MGQGFPHRLRRALPSNFLPLLRRKVPRPSRPAQLPKLLTRCERGDILAVVLFLASSDPHDLYSPTDHVSRALLILGDFRHLLILSLEEL